MKYQTLNSSRSTSCERSTMLSKFLPNEQFSSPPTTSRCQKPVCQSEKTKLALEIELEITQKALKYQTKRCQDLVEIYMKKLQNKDNEIEFERQLRNRQLSYLLRTLFLFEMQLRHNENRTKNQLIEKNQIIASLQKQLSTAKKTPDVDLSNSSCSETSAGSDFAYCDQIDCDNNYRPKNVIDDRKTIEESKIQIKKITSSEKQSSFEIFLSTMGLSTKSLIGSNSDYNFDAKTYDSDTLSIVHQTGSNSFKFWSESYL